MLAGGGNILLGMKGDEKSLPSMLVLLTIALLEFAWLMMFLFFFALPLTIFDAVAVGDGGVPAGLLFSVAAALLGQKLVSLIPNYPANVVENWEALKLWAV